MTESKMDLIVFAATGHLLGAVARTGGAVALEIAELVGAGLPLRDPATGSTWVTVEPGNLKAESVDLADEVLLAPRHFALVDGLREEQATLLDTANPTPILLDGTDITLTLPSPVTEALDACVQVEGGPGDERILCKLKIASGSATTEPLTLASGTYHAIALVPGYRAFIDEVTVL